MRRALLVAAALLAGCGHGETDAARAKREYVRDARAAVTGMRRAHASPAAVHAAADRLRRLHPPAEIARDHRDVVAALDAVAAAEQRGEEPSDAVGVRLIAARDQLAARGYDIGLYGAASSG